MLLTTVLNNKVEHDSVPELTDTHTQSHIIEEEKMTARVWRLKFESTSKNENKTKILMILKKKNNEIEGFVGADT